MVFGEITTKAKVDYTKIVRNVCKEVGFDDEAKGLNYKTMQVQQDSYGSESKNDKILGTKCISLGLLDSATTEEVLSR